ncbi:thioredoxin family protein [Agromyces humatus]|uniref:Thioredoxin domain-containing protein n=1 Tax=Agromyces humatus TaxID=279573 RepID=A0ABN2KR12_9MICO|nr:thioredoxin family protein [Agromyces humatus]
MHARSKAAAALLATALAFTGCATQPTDAAPSGSGDRTSTPSATPEMPTPTADAAPEASAAPVAPVEGAYVDYTDGVIESTAGPKVLFFHATWCPKCRQLDEELRAQGAPDGLTVFKVDYDSRSDLRQKYGVTLQTTVVFVDDRGELISSTVLYDDPSIASLVAAIP